MNDFLHAHLIAAADRLIVDESRHGYHGEPVVLGRQCLDGDGLRGLPRAGGRRCVRMQGSASSSLAELLQELRMHLQDYLGSPVPIHHGHIQIHKHHPVPDIAALFVEVKAELIHSLQAILSFVHLQLVGLSEYKL